MIAYCTDKIPSAAQLMALYGAVGWAAYTKDEALLHNAVQQSLYVLTAWEGERLIGLLRAVGDGLTIVYVQDLLVQPAYQRRGIGKQLLTQAMQTYASVRQLVLLTQNQPDTLAFYRHCGLSPAEQYDGVAFVRYVM